MKVLEQMVSYHSLWAFWRMSENLYSSKSSLSFDFRGSKEEQGLLCIQQVTALDFSSVAFICVQMARELIQCIYKPVTNGTLEILKRQHHARHNGWIFIRTFLSQNWTNENVQNSYVTDLYHKLLLLNMAQFSVWWNSYIKSFLSSDFYFLISISTVQNKCTFSP